MENEWCHMTHRAFFTWKLWQNVTIGRFQKYIYNCQALRYHISESSSSTKNQFSVMIRLLENVSDRNASLAMTAECICRAQHMVWWSSFWTQMRFFTYNENVFSGIIYHQLSYQNWIFHSLHKIWSFRSSHKRAKLSFFEKRIVPYDTRNVLRQYSHEMWLLRDWSLLT